MVASGPDVPGDPLYETLVSQIFAARERIWIVTPYFVPDEMLVRALNLAARRGVDVRLIVPVRSNHLSADLARESYLRELHEAGAHVLLYQPVMLHAKAIIFDDELAVIGSANMDNRSLFLNYEVALFLYSKEQVERRLGLGAGPRHRLPARASPARLDSRAGGERGPAALAPPVRPMVSTRSRQASITRSSIPSPCSCDRLVGRAVSRAFNSGGAMSVVTITINVTPANRPSLKTPLERPIWAKIRPTSPRGIIPTPTTVLFPLNQNGAYPASNLPMTPTTIRAAPISSAHRPSWSIGIERPQVHRSSHADEEERHEEMPQRRDAMFDLLGARGRGEKHPRREGAEDHG